MKRNKFLFLVCVCIVFVFLILSNCIYIRQNNIYKKNYNNTINSFIHMINIKYPELTKDEIISILNSTEVGDEKMLRAYGIDLEKEFVILKDEKDLKKYVILNNILIVLFLTCLLVAFMIYKYTEKKRIKEVTKCLEEINKKNYKIEIDDNIEDNLSILKNEVYKTTIMLKEQAENSKKDKIGLKTSLEDISHQLKTPLTSINIMLDNLLDNPNMDEQTRIEFMNYIKREVNNINFLIQSLLKLSRFDVNTVNYNNKENNVKDIINAVVTNVSTLCDLKNVGIKFEVPDNISLFCDFNWQVEAITNIVKNCIEHSKENDFVFIRASQNKIYTLIEVIDNGVGISKNDIKHIFDRFYKGENSLNDSVGIGLALARSIVEKNNGVIDVESDEGKGSVFSIRYFQSDFAG